MRSNATSRTASPPGTVLETERLRLRRFSHDDAPFVLELVNDPAWLRFIGDRNVHDLDDARRYIDTGPLDMYARHGYGLYVAELKDGTPAGMCGLLKRDYLDVADIGFAFLPRYVGKGLAHEAAVATLGYARRVLRMERVVAITNPENALSVKLLGKLGMRFERMVRPPGEERDIYLFST